MNTPPHRPVKVWDWSVRVFHWSLPVLLYLLWHSAGEDLDRHMLFARLMLGLLLYRIIWGVIGTPYARFSHFVYHPGHILAYLRAAFGPEKPLYLSHNPLGGIMVLAMLGTLLFQASTGLFTTDDIFYNGPLYDSVSREISDRMTRWHKSWFYDGLLLLVGLHLLAIGLYKLRGEGLVKAMITGRKAADAGQVADLREPHPQAFPWLRFVPAVALAYGLVWLIFNGL